MADFGSPVAQNVNVNPSQGIQTLSGLLNLQRQKVGLQQQQQELATQTAQAYQAQQSATERQALAQIPWKSFQNEDGSFDMDKVASAALQVAPTTGQEFVSRFSDMAKGGAETKKAYYALNQTYQDSVRSLFGAWAGDPNADMADLAKERDTLIANAPKSSQGPLSQVLDHAMSIMSQPNLMDGTPKEKDKQKAQALLFSRAGLAGSEVSGPGGVSTPIPGTVVGPGGNLQGTAQSRVTGGVEGTSGGAPLGLSPAQLAQTITLPNGQVTTLGAFLGKSGGGSAPNQTPENAPSNPGRMGSKTRTAEDDMPPANAPRAVQDNFAAAVQRAQHTVTQTRAADDGYGTNMSIASSIRHLASSSTTGPGTGEWNKYMGMLSSRFGSGENISDYQTLGAFLDRQSALLRSQMGLPETNQGQTTAQLISGNTEYQRGAIQNKNNLNEALTEGLHQFRQGLDRVEGFTGNPSPQAVERFRSAWAQNFDPVLEEYRLARSRGDAETANQILKGMKPEERKNFAQKGRNLDLLSQGMVPQ